MEDKEAKSIIEAILFISGEPVYLDDIRKLIEIDKYNTDRLIRELISDYSVRHTGILIIEVSEGFQMVSNPACAPWIKKLLNTSVPKKLTQSSLETIAIVAYKQPIIKAEIEAIRGVNSDGVVKTLLDRRMIKILGRKEVPGRPLMYGTTLEFLQYFGLKDLTELPTLKEFSEVDIPEPPETIPDDETPGELSGEYAAAVSENGDTSESVGIAEGDTPKEGAMQSADEDDVNVSADELAVDEETGILEQTPAEEEAESTETKDKQPEVAE
jgi:segregation and condensation protein B